MFQGSYPTVTEVMNKLKEKQEFVNFHKARSDCFSTGGIQLAAVGDQFWKEAVLTPGPITYKLRSYQLRPGAMIE
ncbi:hypothetical protein LEMLEM_LOCUS11657 [Lemmus lemmus]